MQHPTDRTVHRQADAGGPASRSARLSRLAFKRPALHLGPGWKRATLLSTAVLALAVAPFALAGSGGPAAHSASSATPVATAADSSSPIRGGIHNPPNSTYSRTTGIFARTGGFTNRIENQGGGGAQTLTCRSGTGGASCLNATNQSSGLAFLFSGSGNTGGEILLKNTNGAPFTTNAHGVAVGLNANFLGGKQASEFQLASQPAADSNKLGGQPPSSYVITGQLLFADIAEGPLLKAHRGATAVTQSTGGAGTTYTVTFGTANLTECSFTASPQGGALTSGQLGVELGSPSPSTVVVHAPAGFTGGLDLQVVC